MNLSKKELHLLETVDSLRRETVDFALRLVAQKSTLGNEKGALELMEAQLQSLGFEPIRVPIEKSSLATHPGYAPVPWEFEDYFNVVVHRQADAGGERSVVFNGHLDVVHPGPLENWESDPFQPVIRDGRLFGRGAATHVLEAGADVNAIEKSLKIIAALRGLEAELNSAPRPPAYLDVAHPLNLNGGIIAGGD